MTHQTAPGTQIPVSGLPNLRDLGNWHASGGRCVRAGLMFRSTTLDRVDAQGLQTLRELGLRTVVDFRTTRERQAAPDRLPHGAELVVCDVLGDTPNSAPAQLPKVMADPQGADHILGGGKAAALFERGYRDIVRAPSALAAYRQFFALLAAQWRRPLLFHCTTGKDRTGWAAAITLTLLGVSRDDVMRDYLLTNEQLLPALQPVIDRFAAAGGDPALLMPVLGVRTHYLDAAFDEAQRRFGSIDAYLSTGLGIDDATRQGLRDELTESVTPCMS